MDEGARFVPLTPADLNTLLTIETVAYAFPWSRGNFADSLQAGYLALKMVDPADRWLGYLVAMSGVQEMHLLNLTVPPEHQGQGHARAMLDELVHRAKLAGAQRLWLEVRESNLRAQSVYRRYGFSEVALRRGYYPSVASARENAIVMSLPLEQDPSSPKTANHALD